MKIEGVVGTQTQQDGALAPARLGKGGDQLVTELNPRYYELAYRGLVFSASNAASTSSAGLATTYTGGVCLSNPAGSGKNLVLLRASIACTVITAAVTTAGLIGGYASGGVTAHTTALTPISNLVGSQLTALAKADQAATLVGSPAWLLPGVASSGIAAGVFAATIDPEGSIIVAPGGYVATATSIASPASAMLCSMVWAELPV